MQGKFTFTELHLVVSQHKVTQGDLPFKKLDPVSRVTGIPGWYWILGIRCSDTTGVGLVY